MIVLFLSFNIFIFKVIYAYFVWILMDDLIYAADIGEIKYDLI